GIDVVLPRLVGDRDTRARADGAAEDVDGARAFAGNVGHGVVERAAVVIRNARQLRPLRRGRIVLPQIADTGIRNLAQAAANDVQIAGRVADRARLRETVDSGNLWVDRPRGTGNAPFTRGLVADHVENGQGARAGQDRGARHGGD